MSGQFGSSDDDNEMPTDPQDGGLDSALAKSDIPTEGMMGETPPIYRVVGDSKILVSSQRGKMWKARKKACQKSMKDLTDAWDEAIRYYNHDQSSHRDGTDPDHAGNRYVAKRLNDHFSSTENIVYSNVNAQLPELYAKDPDISITSGASSDAEAWQESSGLARAVEKLINVLFTMKYSPGVGLKTKAKKATVIALLTNRVWFEVGYTQKEVSSDQALQDLQTLSTAITEADDQEGIREAEGALRALEEKVEFLQASGPNLHIRMPHQVLIDPDSQDPNLSDCQWVIIEDMMPTDYVNAVFGEPKDPTNPDDETIVSVYDATHILDGGGDADDDQESFSLFDDKKDYNAYGFEDRATFNKAKRTKVWRVWDRSTRRLELYSDKNWSWPIWVWDDPFQLDSFFPLTPLWFHENPVSQYAKGEVSYYLDQQDQINEINDEKRRALLWARRNIFYDKNKVDKSDIEKILKGAEPTATPIDVPDGMKGTEMIFSIAPPSMNFAQLFDKKDLYAAIDKIAATNDMMRGEQFKTNTTNKAIDYYSTMGNMRMDERLDAIEDCISDVGWKLAQLCMRFMSADVVQQLTGLDVSDTWRPLDNVRDYASMSLTVVGGSTQKLSTQSKKQEAVQVGQILSQFSRAAPASVLKVTLRLFSEAFDDMEIRQEDWDAITEEASKVLAQGAPMQPGQGGPPNGAQPPQPGAQPPGGGMPNGAPPPGIGGNPIAAITTALGSLPPPLLKALGMMLAQGVPPQAIMQHLSQAQQQGPVQ
jgi:hypothetical protein